jgi:uncharacterized protein (TIGR02391 family)
MVSRRKDRPQSANLTVQQMKQAIPKLQRRIVELEAFDPDTISSRDDPRLDSIYNKLLSTIGDVFGRDTEEFHQYAPGHLDTASINMLYETPLTEVRSGVERGRRDNLQTLNTIIDLFHERIEDAGGLDGEPEPGFDRIDLHPAIANACLRLFEDGHYASAVEAACKALEAFVKLRSGKNDESNVPLMQAVFSPNNPILKFNNQENDSQKNEQKGLMWLFSGVAAAIRNPRAHGLLDDKPERAKEYIVCTSMLAYAVDRAERA